MVADLIAVQKNKQALRRERNKVEVFEGKFRSLKFFLAPKRKQTFTCHTSNQNCYTCVRVMFWKKNLHSQKKDSVPTSSGPCTTTLLHSLPNHFVCSRHAGFCWMRTEVADNWFAVVGRFAQTVCICWFRLEALPWLTITWDRAQFKRFSYILSNGYR